MGKRITVRPSEMGPGFYVAFGSDLGVVGFFMVRWNWVSLNGPVELCVWGLSRWRGSVAYRTRGIQLVTWLDRQERGTQYRRDKDRTGWAT